MILQNESTATNTTNLKAEAYTLNADSVIFEVLSSSLYTDKELAVLREYSANAYDAHLAAGIPETPIEITLPTEFEPNLVIRDYGLGLSLDDIVEYFCRYSGSSKRNDAEAIGAFGLGSKSAFALVESFSVTSVNNDIKSVVICYLDNGKPNYTIISSQPTAEPSGTTITIPIADLDKHERLIRIINKGLFSYWEVQPNFTNSSLVNPKINLPLLAGSNYWTFDVYLSYRYWYRLLNVVVLGNFKYNIPSQLKDMVEGQINANPEYLNIATKYKSLFDSNSVNGYNFKLPVSELKVAPSRERLEVTKYNADKLTNLLITTLAEVVEKALPIKEEIKNLVLQEYTRFNNNSYTYQQITSLSDKLKSLKLTYGVLFSASLEGEVKTFGVNLADSYKSALVYRLVKTLNVRYLVYGFHFRNRVKSFSEYIDNLLDISVSNKVYVTTAKPAKVSAMFNQNDYSLTYNQQEVVTSHMFAVEPEVLQELVDLEIPNLVVIPESYFIPAKTPRTKSSSTSAPVRDNPIYTLVVNTTSVDLPQKPNHKQIYNQQYPADTKFFVITASEVNTFGLRTLVNNVNIDNKNVVILVPEKNAELKSARYAKFAETYSIEVISNKWGTKESISKYLLSEYLKPLSVLMSLMGNATFYQNNNLSRLYLWNYLPDSYKSLLLRFKKSPKQTFRMLGSYNDVSVGIGFYTNIATTSSTSKDEVEFIASIIGNYPKQAKYLYRNCPQMFKSIPAYIIELEQTYDSLHCNP